MGMSTLWVSNPGALMPSRRAQLTNVMLRHVVKGGLRRLDGPSQLRRRIARLDSLIRVPRGVAVSEQDAGGVPALWVSTRGIEHERIILHFHGGGFTTRSPNIHGRLVARICRGLGASGLMPDYRLAPEHPFPAAVEDCFTVYQWLLSRGQPARNVVVMGDSAGGGLALATLARAVEEGVSMPGCAVLLSPATDLTFSRASMGSNEDADPLVFMEGLKQVRDIYLNGADPTHPHVSPLFGTFKGLSPLLFQVGSTEMLLDDSVCAAEKALEAGVQVTCEIWESMPHVFQCLEFLPESHRAIHHIVQFVRSHTNWSWHG